MSSTSFTQRGDTFDPRYVSWIMNRKSIDTLNEAIRGASEIVIDLETTGLNEHESGLRPDWPAAARISMASLTLPQAGFEHDIPITYVLPLSHRESPFLGHWRDVITGVAETIRATGHPVTNQHLKYDLRWIHAHTGVDLSGQFGWDTQISSHLLDENSSTALKERAPATFGIDRWDDVDLKTPAASEHVPLYDLGLYAARDTYWTWRLARLHRYLMGAGEEGRHLPEPEDSDEVEMRRLGQLAVWEAMPNAAVLTAIEQRGMRIDPRWVKQSLTDQDEIMADRWSKLIGRYEVVTENDSDPSLAATSLYFRAWTDLAVAAGDLRVVELTPSGRAKWSQAVLRKCARAGSPVAQDLLDYRQASKRAEFLRSWTDVMTADSRIHPTYWPGRVVTGRLSASSPNVQQVTKALKPAFVPSQGYYLAELDYSQVELRVAAFIADCRPMKEAYERGDDLHRLMASQITGKPPAEITDQERQYGKVGNFGLLYGMGVEGLREYAENNYSLILTEEETRRVRDAFFDLWEGMSAWHARSVERARRTGQVISPIGRVRRLPEIHSSNDYLSGHAERNAINAPVQGFASDLMQMSAASIEGYLPGHDPVPDVRLIGTVHDSIIVEVPQHDWKRATARCMRRMIDIRPALVRLGCRMDVPLAVEATVGSRWGQADIGSIG